MTLVGLSTAGTILVGLASGVAVFLILVASRAALRRPAARRGPEIPPGMRPGPSDADLEKPILEKIYGWGLVMVIIMALWVPGIFLRENVTNADETRVMVEESIARGRAISLPGSEENQMGFNCERCHGQNLGGGQNVFNGAIVQVPGLTTVCGGEKYGHPQIRSLEDVIETIAEGRPGTDMPSWSVQFAGAMNDQQVNDVVNYILSIQDVPEKENVCINPVEEEVEQG